MRPRGNARAWAMSGRRGKLSSSRRKYPRWHGRKGKHALKWASNAKRNSARYRKNERHWNKVYHLD